MQMTAKSVSSKHQQTYHPFQRGRRARTSWVRRSVMWRVHFIQCMNIQDRLARKRNSLCNSVDVVLRPVGRAHVLAHIPYTPEDHTTWLWTWYTRFELYIVSLWSVPCTAVEFSTRLSWLPAQWVSAMSLLWEAMSTESRAQFYRGIRSPLTPLYQVKPHSIGSKETYLVVSIGKACWCSHIYSKQTHRLL